MRIISGNYKGRKLYTLAGENTRPTTDRVKESLFNIIQSRIRDNVVLDLFAGSGALGIECLSRGASEVVFCDKEKAAVDVILRNLTGIEGKFSVFHQDYLRMLKTSFTYDIIFVDPPYKSGLGLKALEGIVENRALKRDGVVCYERLGSFSYDVPKGLNKFDTRKYGDTVIDFLNYEDSCINGKF